MPPHRKVESKRGAVGWISEVKSLAETVAKTGAAGLRRRSDSQVEGISCHAAAFIEPGEFEIRFQVVVRQANAELIAGELVASSLKLRAIGEGSRKSSRNVRRRQIAEGSGLI